MSTPRASAETWRERVERWRASGQSVADFCAMESISPKTLKWWRREFQRRAEIAQTSSSAPAFLPVVVEARRTRNTHIEVALASGHVLRVEPGFDLETLRRLVSALGGRER